MICVWFAYKLWDLEILTTWKLSAFWILALAYPKQKVMPRFAHAYGHVLHGHCKWSINTCHMFAVQRKSHSQPYFSSLSKSTRCYYIVRVNCTHEFPKPRRLLIAVSLPMEPAALITFCVDTTKWHGSCQESHTFGYWNKDKTHYLYRKKYAESGKQAGNMCLSNTLLSIMSLSLPRAPPSTVLHIRHQWNLVLIPRQAWFWSWLTLKNKESLSCNQANAFTRFRMPARLCSLHFVSLKAYKCTSWSGSTKYSMIHIFLCISGNSNKGMD